MDDAHRLTLAILKAAAERDVVFAEVAEPGVCGTIFEIVGRETEIAQSIRWRGVGRVRFRAISGRLVGWLEFDWSKGADMIVDQAVTGVTSDILGEAFGAR